jgi:integrase
MGRTAKPYYRKADGWWYATIVKGSPRQKLLKGKPTSTDERKALEVFNRLRASTNPRATLDDSPCANVVELFLDHVAGQGNPSDRSDTYRTYSKLLNYFTGYCGKVLCRDLTLQHAERFLEQQANKKPRRIEKTVVINGKERKQVNILRPWGPNYQATFAKALKACFNWGVDQEIISRNPFVNLKRSFVDTENRDYVDNDVWQAIMAEVKDKAFQDFLTAIRETGCRPGEVRKVTAAHVKDKTWQFYRHKTVKKTQKPRIVWLSPVMQELTARLVEQNPTGPLFLNTLGQPWTKDAVRQRFDSLRTSLNLKKHVVAYAAGRHSYITDAIANGVSKDVIAKLTGTSIKMIDRHYEHLGSKADFMLASAEQATRRASERA